MYPRNYLEIIEYICNKNNIEIQYFDNQLILVLTLNKTVRHIWSKRFEINSSTAERIADNKYATFLMLQNHNIPVIEYHKHPQPNTKEFIEAKQSNFKICEVLLHKYESIVVKPNNSYEGKDVYRCFKLQDIESTFNKIQSIYKFLVASPYIESVAEYRVFYLAPTCLFAYKKCKPIIVGNGTSTFGELVGIYLSDNKLLDISNLHTYSFSEVIPKGEKVEVNWKYNLSQGSTTDKIDSHDKLILLYDLATKAAEAINIGFASVDIIEDLFGHFQIIEINAGVAMDNFINLYPNGINIAIDIYEKAIHHMFSNS